MKIQAPRNRLRDESLGGGEYLTAVAEKTELLDAAFAFVMYLASGVGHIETWGLRELTRPRDMPRRIQDGGVKMLQLAATDYAFAAILEDGTVAAWGDQRYGGDCSSVQAELQDVQQLAATEYAFAAILKNRHWVL
jgi:hypothetical protein